MLEPWNSVLYGGTAQPRPVAVRSVPQLHTTETGEKGDELRPTQATPPVCLVGLVRSLVWQSALAASRREPPEFKMPIPIGPSAFDKDQNFQNAANKRTQARKAANRSLTPRRTPR